MDFTATQTAELTGISRRSVNSIYALLRLKVQQWVHKQAPFNGIVEVDESYFGPRRVPGKCGCGASGNTIVFGIFKPEGKLYTEMVPNAYKNTLQAKKHPYKA